MQRYKKFVRVTLMALLVLVSTSAYSYDFDWVTLGWRPGETYHQYINVNGSGVNVTVNVSGSTGSFQDSAPLLDSDKLELKVDYSHRNEYVEVIFNFSEPITIANFKVWNIDRDYYQDAVQITAIGSGGTILPDDVRSGLNINVRSGGLYWAGVLSLPDPSDPKGLLELSFSQRKITQFTLHYGGGGVLAPSDPLEQIIWLSGFSFEKSTQPHLSVTKTANPSGPVSKGDQIDYSITIKNEGSVMQTGIVVDDPLLGGTSYIAHSTLAKGFIAVPFDATFADKFDANNYEGNSGNHDFSDRWYEHDSSHYPASSPDGHDGGNILVTNNQLKIIAKMDGDNIYREVDLRGSTNVYLTFYVINQLGVGGEVIAEISFDGGVKWTVLRTYRHNGLSGPQAFDIDGIALFNPSNTLLRFRVHGANSNDGYAIIDDVLFTANSNVSPVSKDNNPTTVHPELKSGVPRTLVVATDKFVLEAHQTMTVTYSVEVGTTGNLKSIDNITGVTSDQHTADAIGRVSNPVRGHDFGDAPVSYGDASHELKRPINLYLGASTDKPDPEPASQYSAAADGDNLNGRDDENGVVITTNLVTRNVTATVTVNQGSGLSMLCGWLDFSGNGAFEDVERHCFIISANGQTTETIKWGALPTDKAYTTIARFRVTSAITLAKLPTGNAPDGEVEDYPVSYDFSEFDYGDTPSGRYGDPSHRIHQYLHMGDGDPDSEGATQHSAAADGDDQDGSDDENGVLLSFNAAGTALTATVTVTNMTGANAKLCGWLDGSLNGIPNGLFAGAEGNCKDVTDNTINGVVTFLWGSGGIGGMVPVGDSYARFRFSSDTSMDRSDAETPNKGNGEVEDYFLSAKKDFGDAPLLYGTPSHGVPTTPGLYLGDRNTQVVPDAESTHQPSIDAMGDDKNGTADEDGFSLLSMSGGLAGDIWVVNTTGNPARLCFWFDENANGAFDAHEGRCTTVATDGTNPPGDIHCARQGSTSVTGCTMTSNLWTQPQGSATFARVRLTSDLSMGTATPDGYFSDGEVNDVVYSIARLDAGDAEGYPFVVHRVFGPLFNRPYFGRLAPDIDQSFPPWNAAADFDDITELDDEDGVTFTSPAGTGHSIIATIVVNAPGSEPVKLCGWLDQDLPLSTPGSFDAAEGECKVVNATNCIEITSGKFICTIQWSGLPTGQAYTTYARFRISTDLTLDVGHSPTVLRDGEAEDYRIEFDFTPTAVTIGKVELQALPAAAFLGGLGIEQMDDAALLDMLVVWDPTAAANLVAADRDTIISALQLYLDPDGDGQVAVLAWDTLEERGTIGFYVDRREAGGDVDWVRINNDMLPGLITAPMGGEYQLADPDARSGKAYQYQLIEQEARGSTRRYGPYDLVLP